MELNLIKKFVLVLGLILLCTSAFAALRPELAINDTLKECYSASPNQELVLSENWRFLPNMLDNYPDLTMNETYQKVCTDLGYTYTNAHFSYARPLGDVLIPILIPLLLGLLGGIITFIILKITKSKRKEQLLISLLVGIIIIIITFVVFAMGALLVPPAAM